MLPAVSRPESTQCDRAMTCGARIAGKKQRRDAMERRLRWRAALQCRSSHSTLAQPRFPARDQLFASLLPAFSPPAHPVCSGCRNLGLDAAGSLLLVLRHLPLQYKASSPSSLSAFLSPVARAL